MCLIVVASGLRADLPLILAANRDEFFARPTDPAHFWPDAPSLLAGRDREQGGTWLGVTRSGRVAAVTNFRDGARKRTGRCSRGWLVRDFLTSDTPPEAFLEAVHASRRDYDGFNLIVGTAQRLYYYSNESGETMALGSGVHGLSNHLLNTPWPKVERAKARLAGLAAVPATVLNERLFELLSDDAQAADHELPSTGISLEWERVLSSAFIRTQDYGTRSSTTVLGGAAGDVRFEERSFAPDHATASRRVEVFHIETRA
jgi:uncharacterized protein with NRDE domain